MNAHTYTLMITYTNTHIHTQTLTHIYAHDYIHKHSHTSIIMAYNRPYYVVGNVLRFVV